MPNFPAAPTAARRPLRRAAWLLGPALVAGVAYLDPGNVAANMTAGARYGYLLLWVVVCGNLMAWLVQYLSAKLGVVTGKSLPELLGERFGTRIGRIAYWVQAEAVAMATDVAEVIGGAVALNLLFGTPLIVGGVITGCVSLALLVVQSRRGPRVFETVIVGLLAVIVVGFTAGVFVGPPDVPQAFGGLVPRFEDSGSVLLAASVLGATIMPHAIYAHSSLSRDRFRDRDATLTTGRLLRATRWDVTVAMVIAGSVNLGIMLLAAANLNGIDGTDSLEGAHEALTASLGSAVATLFAIGLLASGLASTAVGAYAGSEIMHGLLRIRLPLLVRRIVTLIPALAILAAGIDPTAALVISQVVLSFGIPFALVPLVALTANADVMGGYRNTLLTTCAGIGASFALIVLNAVLLWLVLTGG